MNKFREHIFKQPILNIGLLGSVSDGKSTLAKKLSEKTTSTHSSEKLRNITIYQGYANFIILKDEYGEYHSTNAEDFDNSNELVHHISFVDCPGHQELIQTMLSSIKLMDGAIIIIAVDQPLTNKPQLIQHLAAAKLNRLTKIIICMNKIDLVNKETLMKRKIELDLLLKEYDIKPYIIIPTCFNKNIGLNYILQSIMELFNPDDYIKRTESDAFFRISRTFDINKPGTDWMDVSGGVIGGTLYNGILKVGDKILISPGQLVKEKDGKFYAKPFETTVLSLKTETTFLDTINIGGLVAIGTDIDPYYCKNNNLAGNIVTLINSKIKLKFCHELELKVSLVSTFNVQWKPQLKDIVSLQIGTKSNEVKLIKMNNDIYTFTTTNNKPLCLRDEEHIIICKNIDKILKIVAESIYVQ
jgi:translation initiation factor 2 subunit 3